MKRIVLFMLLSVTFPVNMAKAQNGDLSYYFNNLPKDIALDKSLIRSYRMTTDYYNFDLKGNFLSKQRLAGIITYGFGEDFAQWREIYYSESKSFDGVFPQGEKQDIMENFRYRQDEGVLKAEFFESYLPEANPMIMNLIWDALAFDALAYSCLDSLVLNREFRAESMNSELKIADIGTFENRDIRVTWIGITKFNNELCAILKYSTMNNPLKLDMEGFSMSGRSHYWGEIYVSLSDMQIEYANLTEDVLTEINIESPPKNILGYTVRRIDLSKMND